MNERVVQSVDRTAQTKNQAQIGQITINSSRTINHSNVADELRNRTIGKMREGAIESVDDEIPLDYECFRSNICPGKKLYVILSKKAAARDNTKEVLASQRCGRASASVN